MSLGLSAYHAAGEFSPRLEYNAKSGRYTRVDKTADGTEVIRADITMRQPVFAWDIGTIEVGFINFQSGAAPSFVVVPYGQAMPDQPDRKHKAGFRSRIWLAQDSKTREFSSCAGATVNAIEALWNAVTATPEARSGQIPVLRAVDTQAISSAHGANYAPVLQVLQWIERDQAMFGPRTVAAPGAPPIVMAKPPAGPAAEPTATGWSGTAASAAVEPDAWSTPNLKAA